MQSSLFPLLWINSRADWVPLHLGIVAIERGAFELCSTLVGSLTSQPIGIMVREFTNGPGDRGSIPSRVIPKT